MLTQAIGDLLPSAVGVAISPVPVIAVILMLATPRARSTGLAFAVGWVVGLVVVLGLVLVVAQPAADPDGATADAVSWGQVAIGVLFLVMAARQWRNRPAGDAEASMPAWMSSIDTFTPLKCLGLGALLSGLNPKNLALTATAAASIAAAGLASGDEVVASAVFVLLASLTVVGPVLFFVVASDRAAGPLSMVKEFLALHNTAIMLVLLLVLGLKLLGQGFGAATG